MAPEMPREQEQSIKARKREIFEEELHDDGPRRPFSAYIAETPPAPLSSVQKGALVAAGVVVVLLLLAALLTMPGVRSQPRPAPRPAASWPCTRRTAGGVGRPRVALPRRSRASAP